METRSIRRTNNPIWLLAILVFVYMSNYVDRVIVGVVGQSIKADLQLSDAQLGLLNGLAFLLFYAVMGIPLGRLADRWNRKWLLVGCLLLWSVMTVLSGAAASFGLLLAARIGVGIGEGGSTPIGHSIIADSFPAKDRGTAIAIFGGGAPLGIILGTLAGGWIAQQFGWRAAMVALGVPGIVLALVIAAALREPERGRYDEGEALAPVPLGEALRRLFADPLFLFVGAGLGTAAIAVYSISAFAVPLLMRSYHLSLFGAASAFGLSYGLSGVVGSFVGGIITDRAAQRDQRWYAGVPAIVYSAAGVLLILALYMPVYQAFVALFVAGAVLLYIGLAPALSVVLNRFGPRMRGAASAMTLMITNAIGLGIGPVLCGVVSDRLAARAYRGAGEFAAACTHRAANAISSSCADASLLGLRGAMTAMICALFVSAMIYLIALPRIRSKPARI